MPATDRGAIVLLLLGLAVAGVAIETVAITGVSAGGASRTAWMPALMVLAGLVGVGLARSRLSPVVAHVVGASVGALVLMVVVADTLSTAGSMEARLAEVGVAAARVLERAIATHHVERDPIGALVLIGAIAWTTGQVAAFNLVRRSLLGPAIVAVGTLVLVVALGSRADPGRLYPHLVALTGIGLLLVLRTMHHAPGLSRRSRPVAGGREAGRTAFRGGVVLGSVAVLGAASLGATLVAPPLRGALPLEGLPDLGDMLGPFGGPGAATNMGAGIYGDVAPIPESWTPDDVPVFQWRGGAEPQPYWWGAAYSTFRDGAWTRPGVERRTIDVAAGGDLLTGGAPSAGVEDGGSLRNEVTVTNLGLEGRALLAPTSVAAVDQGVEVMTDGERGPRLQVDLAAALATGASYRLTVGQQTTGTAADAEVTPGGEPEPPWVRAYLEVPTGALDDDALRVAAALAGADRSPAQAGRIAARMEAFFSSTGRDITEDGADFRYATDLHGVCHAGETVVDCLLRSGRGFCIQYATAMTLMLRSQGIPARYVVGYLPGEALDDGSHLVKQTAAHAWVEALIPGDGWVRFDPTPGDATLRAFGQRPSDAAADDASLRDEGATDAAASPSPAASDGIAEVLPRTTGTERDDDGPADQGSPLDLTWLVAALVLVATAFIVGGAWVAFRRLRHVPGRDADLLYRTIVVLAARMGHGSRATQTPYEVTAMLGKAVPAVREDLDAVARAKVHATYARPAADDPSSDELVRSFRRIRASFLRLRLRRRIGR